MNCRTPCKGCPQLLIEVAVLLAIFLTAIAAKVSPLVLN